MHIADDRSRTAGGKQFSNPSIGKNTKTKWKKQKKYTNILKELQLCRRQTSKIYLHSQSIEYGFKPFFN